MQTTLTARQSSAYIAFGFRMPGQAPAEWAAEFAAAGGTRCLVRPAGSALVAEAEGSPEALALVERTVAALDWATHQRAYDVAVAAAASEEHGR